MFRMTVFVLIVLGCLLSAVAWMDHWGLLGWIHNRIWPVSVISRKPTELELHTGQLHLQIQRIDTDSKEIDQEIAALRMRRQTLTAQLRDELRGESFSEDHVPQYLDEHPVVEALVRSIDQLDGEVRSLGETLGRMNTQKELLKARVITSSNGAVLELRESPGEMIQEQQKGSESRLQRYAAILKRSRQSQ